ncbi:hypothetical protein GJ496_008075 [Pomphorhynchus laevis]|nr:hypothetical protein GJ496_008075 [Pomphorhynchus laevis]
MSSALPEISDNEIPDLINILTMTSSNSKTTTRICRTMQIEHSTDVYLSNEGNEILSLGLNYAVTSNEVDMYEIGR